MADDLRDYFNDRITQEIDKNAQIGLYNKYDEVQAASDEKVAQLNKEIKSIDPRKDDLFWKSRTGSTPFEDIKDVGLAGLQGAESLLKLPTMVVDKVVSGNFYGPATQKISEWQDDQEKMKSANSQYKGMKKAQVAAADGKAVSDALGGGVAGTVAGVATEFGSAFWEALKDPAAIPEFLAQQAAQLGVTGKVGRVVETGAQAAAKAAPKLAATKAGQMALEKSATAGAVGFSAGLQGVDVGSDTMQRLMSLPDEIWSQNPEFMAMTQTMSPEEAKQSIASDLASKATLAAAGASLVTQALPGGTALEKALVGKGKVTPSSVPRAFAGEALQEGSEEGSGQFAANVAVKQINEKQSLAEGIGNAAGQGAFMGGLLGGGAQAIANPPSMPSTDSTDPSKKQAFKAAVDSGDVSALTDAKAAAYDPAMAIQALQAHAGQEGKTPEAKQTHYEQAAQVVEGVNQRLTALRDGLTRFSKEGLEKELAQAQEVLATTDPADVETMAAAQTWVSGIESKLQNFDEEKAAKSVEAVNARIAQVEEHLTKAQKSLLTFSTQMRDLDMNVEDEAKKISEADPTTSQASADKIINLAMAVPERLTTELADSLANNPALSETQQEYFRKFSAARAQENSLLSLGEVSQQVYQGKPEDKAKGLPRMMGIKDYRADIAAALQAGNRKAANGLVKLLSNFSADHQGKAEAAEQAFAQAKSQGGTFRLVSDGNKGWSVQKGAWVSEKARVESGGLNIHSGSTDIVSAIRTESDALNAAKAELGAAVKHFGGGNVKNVSQPEEQQASSSKPEAKTSSEAGSSEGSRDRQPAKVTSVQSDEGSGVAKSTEEAPASAAKSADNSGTESTESTTSTQKTSVELQSTEGTTSKPEDQTVEGVPEAPDVDQATGTGLSVLQDQTAADVLPEGTKLGAVYRTINKVVAFLKQSKARIDKDADIAKDRPLVSIQNFMSRWSAGDLAPSDFFTDGLMDSEIGALNTFQKFHAQWAPLIRANLIEGGLPNLKSGKLPNPDFAYEDPLQGFFKDGAIDENVVTAIAYGAYSWLVDSMNNPAKKSDEDILRMHGLTESGAEVSPEGRAALGQYAAFQDTAAAAIGRYVTDALGLKLNEKAEAGYLNKVQTAFGLQALVLLAQNEVDLITFDTVSGELLNEYLPGIDIKPTGRTQGRVTNAGEQKTARDTYPLVTYIGIRRNSDFSLPTAGKTIKDASVQSFGVLERLFSTENSGTTATWKPVAFTQQRAKRTGQKISTKQRKILEKAQKVEHRIIPEMWNALSVLGDTAILQAAGWTEYNEDRIQAENRSSVQAKNMGLEFQLEGMKALVQGAIDHSPEKLNQPFFQSLEVWRNFRVGVTTRDMNLQGSKIHRFMFFRPEWASNIDLKSQEAKDAFLLTVAQAFGVKVDQQPNAESVKIFNDRMNANDAAIKTMALQLNAALANPQQDILSGGLKADIATFAKDREGMQTLQALVAYGKFLAAEQRGDANVDVHMLVGIDGKTNGPILTHLALGAATNADELFTSINRGGMYRQADGVKNYNHWYQRASSLDLYQDLAHSILNGLMPTAELDAIYKLAGTMLENGKVTSAGRNMAKTPLTAFIFGSSVAKSIENMKATFVQNVFDRIEDVATGRDKQTSAADIVRALNTLMGTKLSENTSIEALMAKTFSKQEKDALANAFYRTIGVQVEDTMQLYFESYLTRRNAVNNALQGSFGIYNAIYQDLRAKEMNRLMDEGEIDFVVRDGKRVPIHDMRVDQEKALREKVKAVMPWANTAYTQGTDETDAGIFMAKTRQGTSDAELNKVKVQLGKRIPSKSNSGWEVSTVTGHALTTLEASPGVAGLPYFMHSLDSFIMHESLEDTDTLNVHDEAANGVNNVNRTAERINKATWNGMLNFSPATEAFNLLARSVENAAKMLAAGELSAEALDSIRTTLYAQLPVKRNVKIGDAELALMVLTYANNAQFEANKIRLEAMAQMTAIDQYTWEGGEYQVTEADRAEAKAMLQRHLQTEALNPALVAAADVLGKAFAESKAENNAATTTIEADKVNTVSAFGALGKPAITSDGALVAFFKANPKATAKQVITMLVETGRLSPVNRKLLQLVSRTVKPELLIQFVTPQTAEADVLEKSERPARGWFVVKGNQEAIYVLSPEFKNSGLTTETLLHELVHAAVATVIDAPSAAAKELVAELEALRAKAAEYAQAAGLNEFADALADVQEFVAWGMSNRDLQEKVLAKISVPTKTGSNALVAGMKKFIDTLTALLWKEDKEVNNGLSVLVSNVSGLFYEAAQTQGKPTKLNLAQAVVAAIGQYTTLDIHAALANGAVSSEFQMHQANLLTGIVRSLHGPFGTFAAQMRKTEAGNTLAVWLKAIETGNAPFASDLVNKGFTSSAQEDFVMEQVQVTVAAALDVSDVTTKPAYRELYKLYVEAKAKLTAQDFINVGMTAADHAFVFGVNMGQDGRSDYLSRFAALGLASEKFNKLLKFETTTGRGYVGSDKSVFDRLVKWFEQVLAIFNAKATKTFIGQEADQKLATLVDRLMDIEAKHRTSLSAKESKFNQMTASFEAGTKEMADKAKQKVLDLVTSPAVQNSTNGFVKWAATLVQVPVSGRAAQYMQNLRSVRDYMFDERDGVIAGLLREAKGPGDILEALILATKHAENGRQTAITQTADVLLKEFEAGGTQLDEDQKASLTTLLRSGAHHLLGTFSLAEIQNLLADPAALTQAIADTQAKLTTRLRDQHIGQAHALGYWKATDLNASKFLMKNAHVIARMLGTQYAGQITEIEAAQEESTIATLATLYSLKYAKAKDIATAAELLDHENARTDGNAVELMLKMHQGLEQESLERLFNNNPIQMIHGYTPEIYDPYITIKVANDIEGKDLEAQGFEKIEGVATDKDVPDANGAYGVKQGLYVRKDGGLDRRVSGAVSLTSKNNKGTTIHNGFTNTNTYVGTLNASMQLEVTNKKLTALALNNPVADLSKNKDVNVAPVFDDRGNVVNWAHLMSGTTRDNVLKRENRFEKVMGALAGSIVDKHTSQELNEKAIGALKDQYNLEKATSPWSYTEVGPLSNDPELREQWSLLPEETRMMVRKIWGRDSMMIRKDSLDGIFGYRKVSAADFLNKERADLKGMESMARTFFHSIAKYRGMDDHGADNFAKRMAVYVTKGERGWQEVYKEVKDIIVVKSGVVLLGNVLSNASLLWLMGVDDGWSTQLTALRGIMAYEEDQKQLRKLESKLNAGYSGIDAQATQNEIARLKDAMARNPVAKLVDAGLMPTIVEDVELTDDPYSYKSQLGEKVENVVNRVPSSVRTVAKNVWMAHDTPQYKFLSRATQYSDFVARYALYEHLVNNEKATHEEAIKKSLRAFVHYDVPMQRTLQYLDDMGFTPFMKYFYRIQSVLMETTRERPARVLGMVLLNQFVNLGPIVLDSSVVHHAFNNPFHSGAARIVDSVGQLATIQTALAVVK